MKTSGMNPNGTGATQITDSETAKTEPTWSPDGTRIAYVASSFDVDRNTDLEIWAINADGSGRKQLTDNTQQDWQPAWSPDADRIAFVNQTDRNIYVMNSDRTGTAINLTPSTATPLYQGNDNHPSWSPDGSQITHANNGDGDADIYKMDSNPTTTDWTIITDPAPGETDSTDTQVDTEPDWSPDGDSIVYVSAPNTSTNRDIYVMDANVVSSGRAIASGTPAGRGGQRLPARRAEDDILNGGTGADTASYTNITSPTSP